jgi:uncharacterized membrane protein YozB (DUF420 family)
LRENRAFMAAHGALLAVVLVGFAASFYLRPWFPAHPLNGTPLGVGRLLHGVALTAWFALIFAQSVLIVAGRRAWHRAAAWSAAAVVPAVVATGLWVNVGAAHSLVSAADPRNMFVWGNFVSLAAFVLLVGAGVRARRRPDAHRRYLLAASIAIVGPAFARVSFWPFVSAGIVGAPAFAVAGMTLALAALVAYDRTNLRHVHPATKSGIATIVTTLVIGVALGASGIGYGMLQRFAAVAPTSTGAAP